MAVEHPRAAAHEGIEGANGPVTRGARAQVKQALKSPSIKFKLTLNRIHLRVIVWYGTAVRKASRATRKGRTRESGRWPLATIAKPPATAHGPLALHTPHHRTKSSTSSCLSEPCSCANAPAHRRARAPRAAASVTVQRMTFFCFSRGTMLRFAKRREFPLREQQHLEGGAASVLSPAPARAEEP